MKCQEKEGKWVYYELTWAYRFLFISPGKWCVSCRTGTGIHLFLLRGCHLWFEHTSHRNRFKFNSQVKDQIQEEIETIFSSRKEHTSVLKFFFSVYLILVFFFSGLKTWFLSWFKDWRGKFIKRKEERKLLANQITITKKYQFWYKKKLQLRWFRSIGVLMAPCDTTCNFTHGRRFLRGFNRYLKKQQNKMKRQHHQTNKQRLPAFSQEFSIPLTLSHPHGHKLRPRNKTDWMPEQYLSHFDDIYCVFSVSWFSLPKKKV